MPESKPVLNFQSIINDLYQKGCLYLKIIPYKKVIFKGFHQQELLREIGSNWEIANNLNVQDWNKWEEFLFNVVSKSKAGAAWPLSLKTWITFHPRYLGEAKLINDFLDTLSHEVGHAVIYNLDIRWGHVSPHPELTEYLKNYCQEKYGLARLSQLLQSLKK